MSWLKNSPLGKSFGKSKLTNNSPAKECDPSACYDSFCKHWQQTNEIIERTQNYNNLPKTDDVLGVVNHLDHMVTLLLMELRSSHNTRPCLEFLLSENLLDKLYKWSLYTGRYGNALRLEQLRLYEVLVSHSRTELLIHEPFHRPLQVLLESCLGECFSVDVEKRLVVLLNQLCVSLVQHNELLHLFFQEEDGNNPSKFVIFSLLMQFVHRDGDLGQQARDALLLCMVLSKNNQAIAKYIANQSVCPFLANGLSGLYSLLPRKLTIETEDWHRFTPDDVNEIPELVAFMNNLEFCNAVVQVAHPLIKNQLLEFLYAGFLPLVMGSALLQSTEAELTAATAYFELFIRSLTEPGLLHSFISFIICKSFDGQRIIDSFIQRIRSKSKLCLVTLALFETLIDLNFEDIMLELVLKHLVPCTHVMLSQKSRVRHIDPYCRSAEKFLSFAPNINRSSTMEGSLYGNYNAYLHDARTKIKSCAIATSCWTYPYDGENPPHTGFPAKTEQTIFTDTDADHSLPSADDGSSGYESFALKEGGRGSESGGECESPCGSGGADCDSASDLNRNYSPAKSTFPIRKSPSMYLNIFNTTPCIGPEQNESGDLKKYSTGPFLEVLFDKLEDMLNLDLYVNLRLTGLISRLAIYPQPLLHSFLLGNSLVFQPSIRSLFQVLGPLKNKIDTVLKNVRHLDILVSEAQTFLQEREERLVNTRKHAVESSSSLPPPTPIPTPNSFDPFERADSTRRSLSLVISSVFRRQSTQAPASLPVFRYLKTDGCDEIRRVVMCAVILDEWLKELAAITQEHAVLRSS
uniref:FHF complex subunit HOOK-interacting protein C-terminal domain-containing protein n=1 Tax=Clastoptera arizonana TaxID=38151 RepID=A0A1B6E9D5_9HEMI